MTNRARELNAINLAQGFPDYDAPAKLKDLVAYHVAAGHNQYAPMIGVPPAARADRAQARRELRSAARQRDRDHDHARRDRRHLLRRAGAGASRRRSDRVRSSYDSYAPAVLLAGGRPIHVPLEPPRFQIDWQRVRQSLSAAHAAGDSQHAAQSDRDDRQRFRSRRARRSVAADACDGARRRGLRAHDLRRRASREHRRSSGALRARRRSVLVRQDDARNRLARRLHGGSRGDHARNSARAPVQHLQHRSAAAVRDRGLPQGLARAQFAARRATTSESATASSTACAIPVSAGRRRPARISSCSTSAAFRSRATSSSPTRCCARPASRRSRCLCSMQRRRSSACCASASRRTTRRSKKLPNASVACEGLTLGNAAPMLAA